MDYDLVVDYYDSEWWEDVERIHEDDMLLYNSLDPNYRPTISQHDTREEDRGER